MMKDFPKKEGRGKENFDEEYFTKGKYTGKKRLAEEENISEEEDEEEEEEEENDFKVQVRELKQRKEKELITRDKDVLRSLKQIENEDRETMKKIQGTLEDDRKRGQSVRHQIEVFRELGLVRIQMQKSLETAKKLPDQQFIEDCSLRVQMNLKYFQVQALRNLGLLLQIRKRYLAKLPSHKEVSESEGVDQVSELFGYLRGRNQMKKEKFAAKYELNMERLVREQLQREEETRSQVEDDVIKWSQKTHLAAQNNQVLKRTNMGMLMQTPIGQVQKALKDYEKLLEKSRLKRDAFRILGRSQENLAQMQDEGIYDDMDLYTQLVKEEIVAENIGEDDQ